MKIFWVNLTARERILVMVAGGLLVLFSVALGVVRPLSQYYNQSQQNLAAAQGELKALVELTSEYSRLQNTDSNAAKPDGNTQSARVIISVSARDAGLVVSRIQPAEDGRLTLWMDSVASPAFYRWLRDLEEVHGLAPELVSLQKAGSGSLRAQVQFAGVA